MSIIDSAVQEHLAAVHEAEVELEREKHAKNGTSKKIESEPDLSAATSATTSGSPRSSSPTRRSSRLASSGNLKKDK